MNPKEKFVRFQAEVGLQDKSKGSIEFVVTDRNPFVHAPAVPKIKAIELAINDLITRFGPQYPNGQTYLKQLEAIAKEKQSAMRGRQLIQLQRTALLDNPLLKRFEKIVAVKRRYDLRDRSVIYTAMPSMNTYSLEAVNPFSSNDELVKISNFTKQPIVHTFFKPKNGGIINEIDLNFEADKLMYSGPGSERNWHVHEVTIDGKYLSQITPKGVDYSNMDSCYLPNGKIIYTSTAPDQGLPCESGRVRMSNTFLIDPKTKQIQRLTYDQDTNWGPTMMEDGRVMYMRWEYSDLPHFFSRLIMTMNPDGTSQKMVYGSNGYWPNSYGRIKPIPGAPSKFIAVLGGHHSGRPGPMCLFDFQKGHNEEKGAIQMIPGYGKKIVPQIKDALYSNVYPKFQNPIPLGKNPDDGAGTYFLVSCKPNPAALWGIYLVDRFDNLVKIVEQEGYALNEPIPLMKKQRPPVIPERTNLKSKTGSVYIANIYEGPGLKSIPPGSVKKLRLFTYHYSYYKAGNHAVVGCESSWDVKHVLGIIPVNPDGSVTFEVPANTPIAIQPLDKNGAALQLMRSWFVARPGEFVSCIGCHEETNQVVQVARTMASTQAPIKISEYEGTARNFNFMREVQPILSKKCASCHNSTTNLVLKDGKKLPDFKSLKLTPLIYQVVMKGANGGPFPASYVNLNPYVRRPGPESNYHLLNPMEFHSNTSHLMQVLNAGHHGVKLTAAEEAKLHLWIDLNVPCWGSYTDAHRYWLNTRNRNYGGGGSTAKIQLQNIAKYRARRKKVQSLYANIDEDLEADQYSYTQAVADLAKITPLEYKMDQTPCAKVTVQGWPFSASEAVAKQKNSGKDRMVVAVPGGQIVMRRIPKGTFVMGSGDKAHKATVEKSFWMADKEVLNKLYHEFDKTHTSRFMDELGKDQTRPGVPANLPNLPVIRVSWNKAVAFTKWLSQKSGKKFRLPTETEWEYAARAGTDTPFYWGDESANFEKYANLADKSLEKFNKRWCYNYLMRISAANDHAQIQTTPGSYKPNAFGLYDMIGNVAEWTSSQLGDSSNQKVARGGSWHQLPRWTPVSQRVPYQPYQQVFNVGIRLVIEE